MSDPRPWHTRFRVYLGERFPLAPAALLGTLIAGATAAHVQQVTGHGPGLLRWAGAAVMVLGFLLALRLADEQKDAAGDLRAFPDRPVPRGLITLRELAIIERVVWVLLGCLALLFGASAFAAWLLLFAYGMLMRREFFVGHWLERRPFTYALTHQPVVLVLVACCAVMLGAPWASLTDRPLLLGALLSLAGFFSYEVGRKLRAPEALVLQQPSYVEVHGPRLAGAVAVLLVGAAACAAAALAGPWHLAWALLLVGPLAYALRPDTHTSKLAAASTTLALLGPHLFMTVRLVKALFS